eukprot:gene9488-8489_t
MGPKAKRRCEEIPLVAFTDPATGVRMRQLLGCDDMVLHAASFCQAGSLQNLALIGWQGLYTALWVALCKGHPAGAVNLLATDAALVRRCGAWVPFPALFIPD